MRRIPRVLTGLFLVGVAVAVAVLVLGQGGATPAAAQPADPHYKCYDIPGTDPPDTVQLETQFGVEPSVAVGLATKLCLPAGKNGQPIPPGWPHLKCYTIAGQNPPNIIARLTTQFGNELNVAVGQATLLCVPAVKTVVSPPEPTPTPGPPLTQPKYECFDIVGSDPPDVVSLQTQFGIESGVAVGQATKLCAPALVNGQGNLNVPDLKCYNLTGLPVPGRTVNLETQFGVELNIVVGPPSLLCVPAAKQAVGGIAEVPAVEGGSSALATDSGGLSAGGYAALAAGLAAAAAVIGVGGWYARRRWLR